LPRHLCALLPSGIFFFACVISWLGTSTRLSRIDQSRSHLPVAGKCAYPCSLLRRGHSHSRVARRRTDRYAERGTVTCHIHTHTSSW
jgi:hypothetical protein